MGRALYFNNGAWRRARALWVNDGIAWRKAKTVYVHDGAAWRASSASQPVNFSGQAVNYITGMSGAAECICSFEAGGLVTFTGSQSSAAVPWYDAPEAGIGAAYWIRATTVSGQAPNEGDAMGAWLQLTNGRWWGYITQTTGAFVQRAGSVRFDISSDAAGSTIVCSGVITFSATREA